MVSKRHVTVHAYIVNRSIKCMPSQGIIAS